MNDLTYPQNVTNGGSNSLKAYLKSIHVAEEDSPSLQLPMESTDTTTATVDHYSTTPHLSPGAVAPSSPTLPFTASSNHSLAKRATSPEATPSPQRSRSSDLVRSHTSNVSNQQYQRSKSSSFATQPPPPRRSKSKDSTHSRSSSKSNHLPQSTGNPIANDSSRQSQGKGKSIDKYRGGNYPVDRIIVMGAYRR